MLHDGPTAAHFLSAALRGAPPLPPPPPPPPAGAPPCPACLGLLTASAAVRMESLTVASGSTVCARMEKGGGTRYSKAGIGAGAAAPAGADSVAGAALRYVAESGFDLRDGIGLRMNISTAFAVADAEARRALAAAFAAAAPAAAAAAAAAGGGALQLPACAMEIREALRCALEAALQRLAYRGLPRGALLLTVEQAASLLDAAEGGGAGGAAGGGAPAGGGEGAPFSHPAMARLREACLALPAPPDPRVILRLAHEACEEAFSSGRGAGPALPAFLRLGGEEVATERLWVSLGTLGEGGGGPAARLAAAGASAPPGEGGGGGGGGGGAPPALPLPPAPPADCALLSPTLSPTSSLMLNVEAVVGAGGAPASVAMGLSRAPLFVKGRYLKLARGLSQTPWFLNGARKDLAEGGGGDGGAAAAAAGGEEGAAAAATSSVEEQLGFPISASVFARYAGRGVVEGLFPVRGGGGGGGGGGSGDSGSGGSSPPLAPPPAAPAPAALSHAPLFTFHSAGREDVDVRMLGAGRPFAIELNACRPVLLPVAEFARMASLVNGGAGGMVVARCLRPAGRAEFEVLAKGADSTRKEYVALVWSEAPFCSDGALAAAVAGAALGGAGARGLALAQRTPIRVLHRRSLLTRSKALHGGAALRLADHFFLLHVTTSAGTYVKEFVHGDFGRTEPCLGVLLGGGHCDILALDVVGHREGAPGEGAQGEGGEDGE